MGIRLAVFDCDGTLVDSAAAICRAMGEAFDGAGLVPPRDAETRRIVGLSLTEAMRELVPDGEEDLHAELARRYKEAFAVLRARGQVEEPLFPGALGALAEIEAQGWLLGVATGKSDRGLRHCLERHGIHGRFMTLQTADRHPSKPHPSMLDAARDAVGAGEVAMIGDTTFDISMALAASADPIGVGWGYHAPAALAGAGARVIAQRFADLPAIMER